MAQIYTFFMRTMQTKQENSLFHVIGGNLYEFQCSYECPIQFSISGALAFGKELYMSGFYLRK